MLQQSQIRLWLVYILSVVTWYACKLLTAGICLAFFTTENIDLTQIHSSWNICQSGEKDILQDLF